MNHNFADWELTQLLPKYVPFENKDNNTTAYIIKSDDYGGFITYIDSKSSQSPSDYESPYKESWTWEDIRLYLLKNNYHIVIDILEVEDEIKYESIIYVKDKDGELTCSKSYFGDTYEESRRLAIKHCLVFLKLMNNG